MRLAPGVQLVERSSSTVQLGIDDVRRVLIHDAPPGTAELLGGLNGEGHATELIDRVARRHCMPNGTWSELLGELVQRGLITPDSSSVRGSTPVQCVPERVAVAALYGEERAGDAMRCRSEAVVVVVGAGRVASSVISLLAAAGVGHIHPDPQRPLRATDVAPAGVGAADLHRSDVVADPAGRGSAALHRPARRDGSAATTRNNGISTARRSDQQALVAMIRRISPSVRVHPPSGDAKPSLVVLATDGPPPPELPQRLVSDSVAHLAVRASETRGVVGPLVLPRRSSCLHCHDLHRVDADPEWPKVRLALSRLSPIPPAVLATQLAAVAAGQVLEYLDGSAPAAIDGTLELSIADWAPRRRSWQPHPWCFCGSAQPR